MFTQPSRSLQRARAIAILTTLGSFVVGVELVEGHGPGYRLVALDLLLVVAIALVGAVAGRGAAVPMRRWLTTLCLVQSLFWIWLVVSRGGVSGFGLTIGVWPVLGYGLALVVISRERHPVSDGG